MILEEFDPARAVIEPEDIYRLKKGLEVEEICDTIIMPFSGSLFEKIISLEESRYGGYKSNINGKQPWYIYEKDGQKVAVMKALLGGPALVGTLEELKVAGFKNFILFGTCGVLDGSLESNKLIVPTSRIRDEGISYHYAPASDEIGYSDDHLSHFTAILDKLRIPHTQCKAWTTDAFYRETPDKVARRKAAGAKVVDMEWASVAAWAQFRQAAVYHFFYSSDFVDHENGWDIREGHEEEDLMNFFEIALAIAGEL
ncbi:nucleoside phosphorylase [Streptococcus loxodontisalivarius]|uniref:Uridine phosphorylase n=1 Tax=Streptococcus loxodontisalivarius TaxID=1349415 RepID=A0ABS2PTZ6_9STRE|nr:nucleoside phosphorylase [Streptococcus loxodontisalivarius]MBM7643531.1 uridine phosphorylase [Streptococcus loxodontisalivarius]